MKTRAKITQYGSKIWDTYWDSSTQKFEGSHHSLVNGVSCALTAASVTALNAHPGDWLRITFDNGVQYYRRYDDTAPEDDARCDFFNYYAEDLQMNAYGDFALVERMPNLASLAVAS